MRKVSILFVVIAVGLVGLSAPVAADSSARPFKGALSGSVAFVPFTECVNYGGFNLRTDGNATGNGSHLGATVMESAHCTPDMGVEEVEGGEMTLFAANGDEVWIEYEGFAPLIPPTAEIGFSFAVDIDFVVVGGTGRFEGATGGGDMTAFITFEGFEDMEWPASWEWYGTLGY